MPATPRAAAWRAHDSDRGIMHDASQFLGTLTLVLGVAAVTTVVFHLLRQPVVLGYLLAGLLIGPHLSFPVPLVADQQTVHTLSELGVILLMFSLGLEFSLSKLARAAPTAGVIGVAQCSVMLWLGYVTGVALGWTPLESFYTGAIVAISSTTIIVKAFTEENIKGAASDLVFGILIVEDLVAIVLLAVLTAVSSGAGLGASDLAWTVFRLAGFLVGVVTAGLVVVPPLFRFLVRLDRPEMVIVASVGFCFAVALLAHFAGYSVALGAFLAGALVAESGRESTIENLVGPVRDIFAAIFFVAVGMLIDPVLIAEQWLAVAVLTLVVLVGKIVSVSVPAFFTGFGIRTSIQAGMSLAQIGEFSFIIAGVGLALGSTRSFLYPVAVAVSAVTTLLTPWLIRHSHSVSSYVDARLPRPLQSFAALYGTWLEALRASFAGQSVWHRVRRLVTWLVIDAACVCAIVVGAALSSNKLAALLGEPPIEGSTGATLVAVGVAVVGSLPFFIGIVRSSKALGVLLANRALPAASRDTLDLAAAPRRSFVAALQFGIMLFTVMAVVAVVQPFLPAVNGALLLVTMTIVLGFGFWRTATDLQGHVRAGGQMVAQLLASQTAATAETANEPRATLERALPGFGGPIAVRIQETSQAVGKSLTELNLRGRTGATVIAIARGDEGFLPTGKETLREGDVLALVGTQDATAAARELLVT